MTTVAIHVERTEAGGLAYRAVAGDMQSTGRTPGEALDAIRAQFDAVDDDTLVVIRNMQPDRFFTAEQQARLAELMSRWRGERDAGRELSSAERAELDSLVEAELRASGERAKALAERLPR